MSLIRRFLHVLGGRIGMLVVSIIVTPILVRALGSTQYGNYAFLLSVINLSFILINTGIFNGTRKFLSEDRGMHNWKARVIAYHARISITLDLLIVAIVAFLVYSGFISSLLGPEFNIYFLLVGTILVLQQIFFFLRACLMGVQNEGYSEPLQVGRKAVFALIALPLAILGCGIGGILAGDILALTVACGISILLFKNHTPFSIRDIRSAGGLPNREFLSYNFYSILFVFLMSSLYNLDIILLRVFIGGAPVGYYKAALVVAEFLWFVPNAVQTLLLHSSSELWSTNNLNSIEALATKATRYVFAVSLLMAIGILCLARTFIRFYFGSEFIKAVLPLLILLPGSFFFAVARPIFAIGEGHGRLRPLIYATGAASGINLLLNLLLIPKYGMYGAAFSTTIGYGSMIIGHIISARKIGFDPISDLRLVRILSASIVSFPFIYASATYVPSFISLITTPIIGLCVYAPLCIKLGVVSQGDLEKIPTLSYLSDNWG